MATMSIPLPDAMKDWVEGRPATGRYSNASDHVRDLIRKDREREGKVAALRLLIEEGEASGLSALSADDIWANVLKRADARKHDL